MIEHRGITCLACVNMSLQERPAEAKYGWSTCKAKNDLPPGVFMRVQMSRNCKEYEAADPATVEKRDTWAASNIKLPAWQR